MCVFLLWPSPTLQFCVMIDWERASSEEEDEEDCDPSPSVGLQLLFATHDADQQWRNNTYWFRWEKKVDH